MFYQKNRFSNAIILASLLFAALTFPIIVSGQSQAKKLSANKLIYVFEPVIRGEAGQFRVDLYFRGNSSGTSKLRLPSEWGGQERLYNQIKNLRAVSPDVRINDTSEPHLKSVIHPANAVIHIQYDVIQDWNGAEVKDGLYNRAVLQKNYFYLVGDTFLVYPDREPKKQLAIQLRWKNIPPNWSLAHSFGAGKTSQTVNVSLNDLIKGVYFGGDFRIKAIPVRGKPIYTATRGSWKFSDEQFQSLVRRIMETERAFWNDEDFPYYLVMLFPTDGADTGGEARTNAFTLYFPKETETVSSFNFSLAHELFHLWNPIRLGGLENESLYWFSEGFTDYYASLLLMRAGLLSLDEYVSGVNELLKLYYTSPARNLTDQQILIDRRNSYDAERQPYQRGSLLAHNWNARIKSETAGKYSLDDVMRDLFKASRQKGFVLSEKSIDDALRRYLRKGVRNDIKQHLEAGDVIVPHDDIVGSCFVKRTIEIAPFEAGFDIEATLVDKVFRGVREDGNAYKAGMRNGQKWVGGGMVRDPKVSAEFIVEESGIRKNIKFYPAGNNKTSVPQFYFESGRPSNENVNCLKWFDVLPQD